jgi:hypothetical protein
MYIRNYKGEIVYFNINEFAFEYDMYIELWKIKYNIDLSVGHEDVMTKLIKYIEK